MKVLSRLLFVLIALTLLINRPVHAQDNTFPRTVTDGAGNKVTINARPMKIVSAALASDEILLTLVGASRLAAVTSNASDPTQSNIADAAKAIPGKLGTPLDPESIVALRGDLVIVGPFTDQGIIKQLRDAKLPVFLLGSFNNIKDIENNITLLGQVAGEEQKAAQLVSDMEARLKTIADAVQGVKPLTVMYYSPDGYASGPGSMIDEVIVKAGGINAVTAGGVKEPYPQLNDEFVVKADPDVILLSGFNSYAPGFVDKFVNNPNFKTLKAMKNKRVIVANDAHIASISQYVVDGVSDLAALLYPDAYKPAPIATLSATMSATAAK